MKALASFARFWSKVDADGDCWEWTATRSRGYGYFRLGGRMQPAHRVAWELLVEPIREGLQLDHLCKNTTCVNPDHLEPVTPAENSKRSASGMHFRTKTNCPQGHPYAGDNLYVDPRGARQCRECRRRLKRRQSA